jgi:acyl-CoA reductase-like NAD-dependent aldehyde dehydrogenase
MITKGFGDMGEIRPLLVDGEWISQTGQRLASSNPATGQDNGWVAAASPDTVEHAVRSGARAAADPAWRNLLPHQRARLLSRVADAIAARAPDFARAQMLENGKVLAECRAQATAAEGIFRYYAAVCETAGAEVTPARGNYLSMTSYEPYGVVVAIAPWNSPLTMEAQKVAPALAAGNAVILKPSEVTPSAALELGRAALAAGLPPGILNVLPGTGAMAGEALVRHRDVRMVSFTGGTESGRRIARVAAEKLMPVALELGGKSPHIVFADADLDAAAASVAGGIFEGSGQSCVAGSRLFVQRACYDAVLEKVVRHADALVLGLPDAAGAQMGPLASFGHRERIEKFVAIARAEGGAVLAGGMRPDAGELQAGAYYRPTVIAGLPNSATVCQQEIFGPVLCVLPFDDEDDLVAQANDSAFGLAAGIWTASFPRAWRVAQRLQAGTVWINTYKQLSISTPFGGFKDSGLGREKGMAGLRLYQQQKSIYWGL